MVKHSRFAPSASNRWMTCTGSPALEAKYSSMDSGFSVEGSAAHELAAHCAENGLYLGAGSENGTIKTWVENAEYPDFPIDQKMVDAVNMYTNRIDEVKKEHPGGETTVECKRYYNPAIFGYIDCIYMTDDYLYIPDFKYGAGISVGIEHNSQSAIYGLATLLSTFSTAMRPETTHLEIIQPNDRNDNVIKTIVWKTSEFIEYWQPKIDDAYNAIKMGITELVPGPHCQFCRAALDCPKNTMLALPTDAIARDPAKLAEILQQETAIREALKQAKAYACELIKRGVEVPGYKMVEALGNRTWKNEKPIIKACADIEYSPSEYLTEPKLKSPNQLKGLLDKKFIDRHVVRPPRGHKLVESKDRREPAKFTNPFEDN